jgi:hypothetical protein
LVLACLSLSFSNEGYWHWKCGRNVVLPRGATRVDKTSPIPIGRKGQSPALVVPQYIIEPRQGVKDGGRNRRPVEQETNIFDSPSILVKLLDTGRYVLLFQPPVNGNWFAEYILHRYLIKWREHPGLSHCLRRCTSSMMPHDHARISVNHGSARQNFENTSHA